MRGYTQLAQEERYQIYALMKAGHSQSEIAAVLGRSKSTISRELRRNCGLRGYRPKQAQRLAQERRQAKVKPRLNTAVWVSGSSGCCAMTGYSPCRLRSAGE
jgi:IS30 family transposase